MKRYYFFGAGINCWGAIKFVGKENIIAIVDNSQNKIGKKIDGVEVISFQDFLKRWQGEQVLITVFEHEKEVAEQLRENGVTNYSFCPYMQSGYYSMEEIIKMYNLQSYDALVLYGQHMFRELLEEALEKAGLSGKCKALEEVGEESAAILLVDSKLTKDDVAAAGKTEVLNLFSTEQLKQMDSNYIKNGLQQFHNIHAGKRCFIIGNGPSLRSEDLDLLHRKGELCFGVNSIHKVFEITDWRPDYYVMIDFQLFPNGDVTDENVGESEVFMPVFYNLAGYHYPKGVHLFHQVNGMIKEEGRAAFSSDITKQIYSGLNVVYNTLQIAAYMGFSEIYLLGVDFSYGKKQQNHFYEKTEPKQEKLATQFYKDEISVAFAYAEEYSKQHGFRIYNATRGGELEIFERVDFDTLMQER